MNAVTEQYLRSNLDILCCPRCGEGLLLDRGRLQCRGCQQRFEDEANVPLMFCPNDWGPSKIDKTETVKAFYEETPFPNYDDLDDVNALISKTRRAVIPRLLNEQVPVDARVLECGCGTGQWSNFLSINGRRVIGTDACVNSLSLAQRFKEQNALATVQFIQMNLFRPVFKPESFDLVICNGVLHHTSDPRLGFRAISRLVKPNGYLLIGLYHKYGRLMTDLRRLVFNLTGDRFHSLDKRLADASISAAKRHTWFRDQYQHPQESKHTIAEVLGWLQEAGFAFVNSIPKARLFSSTSNSEHLLSPQPPGHSLERFLAELGMTFTGDRKGNFFIVIGRKLGTVPS
jgi:SAM-dependent methyltransferase